MLKINELGNRICIIGCSNSGKSTLCDALSKALQIDAYHLDQYAHIENSNWQRQTDDILIEKHNEIIQKEAWIIEGNYSVCMEPRFDRATCIIWLDLPVIGSVLRYFARSIKNDTNRPGKLSGAKKEFQLSLVKWILFQYPKNRLKYKKLLQGKQNIKLLKISSMKELNEYYNLWKINQK